MSDLVESARARLAEIEIEAVMLRSFIETADKVRELLSRRAPPIDLNAFAAKAQEPKAKVARGTNPPVGLIIRMAKKVLIDFGRPLTRRDLHAALAMEGIIIQGVDPLKSLGTIIWRNRDEIITIEGRGYWPKDIPVPPATQPGELDLKDLE